MLIALLVGLRAASTATTYSYDRLAATRLEANEPTGLCGSGRIVPMMMVGAVIS